MTGVGLVLLEDLDLETPVAGKDLVLGRGGRVDVVAHEAGAEG